MQEIKPSERLTICISDVVPDIESSALELPMFTRSAPDYIKKRLYPIEAYREAIDETVIIISPGDYFHDDGSPVDSMVDKLNDDMIAMFVDNLRSKMTNKDIESADINHRWFYKRVLKMNQLREEIIFGDRTEMDSLRDDFDQDKS